MLLTVNPNTALERVLEVSRYVPGERLAVIRDTLCIGGKGNLASAFAADLGAPTVALGFAAGKSGKELAALLHARGAKVDFSPAQGETRRTVVVVDEALPGQTWLMPESLRATQAGQRHLRTRFAHWLRKANWAALCGSLPKGCPANLYRRLTREARARGIPVLIDARGPALAQALASRPEVVRLNREELELTLQERIPTLPRLLFAMRRLVAEGIQLVICTLGKDGAVAVTDAGGWRVVAPAIQMSSSAGSGDAFTAALLVWREKGADWPEALRWASAAGTAKAIEAPTDAPLDLKRVRAIYRRVRVSRL
ncbi:MAG: 1-phosphofructokinase family hexose kinase [Terriglobia bacterium]